MSMILLGLIAAAAALGVGGVVAVVRRRRPPPRLLEAPPPEPPHPELAAAVGDVIQFGTVTRWPQSGLLVRDGDQLVCAILLSRENDKDQATVALAPPARHLLWLDAVEMNLPGSPPARVEIDGLLLDRERCFPATLEPVGGDPSLGAALVGQATVAIYQGRMGDAALVVSGAASRIWYGNRLEEGDYDNLGAVAAEG